MNYRELQAAVKAAGLNAKGSKAELIERLENATEVVVDVPVNKDFREFVFTGDPNAPGQDPAWCSANGYMFGLNGRAITVTPDVAVKLASHSHFTEK